MDGYIEQLLTPGVEKSREIIRNRVLPSSPGPVNIQPISPGPVNTQSRTELPSQITGTPVSAEILRTSSNIFAIGVKELTSTNPFIRQMGARRLVGLSTVLGGAGYTIKIGAQYVTGVTDDEMDAFQRSFAPQYQRNSPVTPCQIF